MVQLLYISGYTLPPSTPDAENLHSASRNATHARCAPTNCFLLSGLLLSREVICWYSAFNSLSAAAFCCAAHWFIVAWSLALSQSTANAKGLNSSGVNAKSKRGFMPECSL
ncbi:hypothetical protein D3C76_1243810 [compost metagenome]